jgi:hypothetical protein
VTARDQLVCDVCGGYNLRTRWCELCGVDYCDDCKLGAHEAMHELLAEQDGDDR